MLHEAETLTLGFGVRGSGAVVYNHGALGLAALAQDESRLDLVSHPEAFPALWERLARGS